MTSYVCLGCNQNCEWQDWKLNEMGILVGREVYDVICPYCGFDTEFVRLDEEEEEEDIA